MIAKHLENILLAAPAFAVSRNIHQTAATLMLAAGMLAPPALWAGGLQTRDTLHAMEWTEVNMASMEHAGLTSPRYQFDLLERRPSQKSEEEAKIQAQAEYLAEKYSQSISAVRSYVELAWKEAARRDGLPAELLIAIMQKESALRPQVQSRHGAQGLMQVVRRWHRDKLHKSESLFDPEVNIRVAADVLEEYLEEAGGSLRKALGKYSGNARGYAATVLKQSHALARIAAEAADDTDDLVASKG